MSILVSKGWRGASGGSVDSPSVAERNFDVDRLIGAVSLGAESGMSVGARDGGATYRSEDRTSGRARYEYIISSGSKGCWHMRRLGGSTLSPSGTLFSSLPWPPISLSPLLSLSLFAAPSRKPAAGALLANYTCANQPTSNEARPVALSVGRVEPLLSSQPGGWVERGPARSPGVSTTSLTLLNYPEALTNFRPPMPLQPFAALVGKGNRRPPSLIGRRAPRSPSIPPEKRLS